MNENAEKELVKRAREVLKDHDIPLEPGAIYPAFDEQTSIKATFIAMSIERWIEWKEKEHKDENILINNDTYLMSLPVPYWPSIGMCRGWVKFLRSIQPRQPIDVLNDVLTHCEEDQDFITVKYDEKKKQYVATSIQYPDKMAIGGNSIECVRCLMDFIEHDVKISTEKGK